MNNLKNIFEHRYYGYAMLASVFCYSLFFLSNDALTRTSQVLLFAGSLPIFIYHRKSVFSDPMFKLLIAAIFLQCLSWAYSSVYLPEFADSGPKIDRLAKLFSFFFIAYWLKGKVENVYFLWGALAAGVILGCFTQADFVSETILALTGKRVDYGLKNAQFATMLAGVSLLIAVFFAYQCVMRARPFKTFSNSKWLLSLTAIFSSIVFFTFIAMATQSRQVWLALAVVSVLLPILFAAVNQTVSKKKIFVSYSLLLLIGLGLTQSSLFQKIVNRESSTVEMVLSGNISDLPMDNTGLRIHSWFEAITWIKQSPIIGNDNTAIGEVIRQSDKFSDEIKELIGHLHNYHIETLVAYGILGLVLVYSLYGWLIRSLYLQRKINPELTPFLLFSLIFATYWFIVNSFETFNGRSMGVYVHNIMFAGFYTFYLTHSFNQQDH